MLTEILTHGNDTKQASYLLGPQVFFFFQGDYKAFTHSVAQGQGKEEILVMGRRSD